MRNVLNRPCALHNDDNDVDNNVANILSITNSECFLTLLLRRVCQSEDDLTGINLKWLARVGKIKDKTLEN